jgi:signal transduction histidine kinase
MLKLTLLYLLIATQMLFSNEITTRILKIEQSLDALPIENRVDSLINLVYLSRFDNPRNALRLAETELKVIENRNDLRAKKGYLLNGIGEIYNRLDQFDVANKYYKRALSIFIDIKDKKGEALVLYNLGFNIISLRDFKKAGEYLLNALNLANETNNLKVAADAQSGLGVLNYIVGNYKEALKWSELGLELATKINYKKGMALANGHIGLAYLSLGNYQKSLFHFQENLKLSSFINDLFGIGEAYEALGVYYLNTDQFNLAFDMLQKATVINEKLGLINSLASTYTNMGVVKEYLNELNESLFYLNKALKLIDGLNDYRLQYYIHRRLSYTYEKLGNYKKALENYRLFKTYNDSVYDNAKNQIVQSIEREAEASKKMFKAKQIEAENNLVRRTQWFLIFSLIFTIILLFFGIYLYSHKKKLNAILSKANLELKLKGDQLQIANDNLILANNDKDKFINILAHDLRSPFFGILGMTSLMYDEFEKMNSSEHKNFLGSLNSSLRNLFEFLNNILNYGKLSNQKFKYEPKQISVCKVINNVLKIFKFNIEEKRIVIKSTFDNNCFVYADENMLETILRNLIANAIKFSNENGTIEINSDIQDNYLKLSIIDKGQGIKTEDLEKILSKNSISTKGTKNEEGSGLGLEICKEYITINKGNYGIESVPNEGTTFWFTVPITKEAAI